MCSGLFPTIGMATVVQAVVYVDLSAAPGGDGSSWAQAFRSVQEGLDQADALDQEVWVAKGEYPERIILKEGVALYGGFSGGESLPTERDPVANETILNGGGAGSTVTGADHAIIDGFTITGGHAHAGGGIYNLYTSPTIRNNIIRANSAGSGGGGGIYNYGCSAQILENTIRDNVAAGLGGGIYNINATSSLLVEGNLIVGNRALASSSHGGGIMNANAPARIVHNCIRDNIAGYGGGVYNLNSSPAIENNTLVNNDATYGGGIWSSSGSSPVIMNNIICGSSGYGVYSIDGTDSLSFNNVWNNTPANHHGITAGTGDISVDPRFADAPHGNYHLGYGSPCASAGSADGVTPDGTTDIGAYPAVTVGTSGADYTAIMSAIADLHARGRGGSVLVHPGTYVENVVMQPRVDLLGAGRDLSIIDPGGTGTVVRAADATMIDGFTLTNGGDGGIYCRDVVVTISNNAITDNHPHSEQGGGISMLRSSGRILSNLIARNGKSHHWGGGIHCVFSSPIIANNWIFDNVAFGGGGVYCWSSSPRILNNTICNNQAGLGAVIGVENSNPLLANNIISGNSGYGVFEHPRGNNDMTLLHNNLFGNAGGQYYDADTNAVKNTADEINSLDPPGNNEGNIVADPKFVNAGARDYHLRLDSPCINRGTPTPPAGLPETDIDGEERIANNVVDIGADELAFIPVPCHDPFADADGDGDVDQIDFAAFQRCYTGPNKPFAIAMGCGCFDRDGDDDVDMDDLESFAACFSGPMIPADPDCAE